MKILLVASRYPPHHGGLETAASNLARGFCTQGHQVIVVTNRYPRSLPPHETIDAIPIRRFFFLVPQLEYLHRLRLHLFAASLVLFPVTLVRLAWLLVTYRPDVINLHYLGEPTLFVWLLHLIWPIPWVISLHGGDVDGEPHRGRFQRWLFHVATQRASAVTACSMALLRQATALEPGLAERGIVVHNGVDVAQFAAAEPYHYSRPYILAVGQLVAHKGFDLLIRSFSQLASSFQDVDLLIAGDGVERGKLQTLISDLGMDGRVRLLGKVASPEVASLMRGCCFVSMSSYREPFGIVALEAMAAGKAVLATPIGGVSEFANTSSNRLVPPEDDCWVKAMTNMLSRDLYGTGQLLEENVEVAMRYDWRAVTENYLQVIESAVKRKGLSTKCQAT